VVTVDPEEKFLVALLLVFVPAYAVSHVLRDYWSALNLAVCILLVAVVIVERRCRRWCKREFAKQVDLLRGLFKCIDECVENAEDKRSASTMCPVLCLLKLGEE
jgi:hypothetical protein